MSVTEVEIETLVTRVNIIGIKINVHVRFLRNNIELKH